MTLKPSKIEDRLHRTFTIPMHLHYFLMSRTQFSQISATMWHIYFFSISLCLSETGSSQEPLWAGIFI